MNCRSCGLQVKSHSLFSLLLGKWKIKDNFEQSQAFKPLWPVFTADHRKPSRPYLPAVGNCTPPGSLHQYCCARIIHSAACAVSRQFVLHTSLLFPSPCQAEEPASWRQQVLDVPTSLSRTGIDLLSILHWSVLIH